MRRIPFFLRLFAAVLAVDRRHDTVTDIPIDRPSTRGITAGLAPVETALPETAVSSPSPPPPLLPTDQSSPTSTPTSSQQWPSDITNSVSLAPATSYFLTPSMTTPTASIPALTPWPTVPIAKNMGLIMPNPYYSIYVGVAYVFGFVEPGPRPAPIAGGWMRDITPYMMMPNDTIDVFPSTGTLDPRNSNSTPVLGDPLCGALTVYNWAYTYPFIFNQTGLYTFAVNQTWLRPTVEYNRCMMPVLEQRSFFATQAFNVSAYPTDGTKPSPPSSLYTVWAAVDTETPLASPSSSSGLSRSEKLAAGLAISFGLLGLVLCFLIWWWCRKRIQAKQDMVAFSRLRPQDKQEFLSSNPESPFNPMRPAKRHYWTWLCLHAPPGSEPAPKIPRNKKFIPPAYARPATIASERPLMYGHKRAASSVAGPTAGQYLAPPSVYAHSAYGGSTRPEKGGHALSVVSATPALDRVMRRGMEGGMEGGRDAGRQKPLPHPTPGGAGRHPPRPDVHEPQAARATHLAPPTTYLAPPEHKRYPAPPSTVYAEVEGPTTTRLPPSTWYYQPNSAPVRCEPPRNSYAATDGGRGGSRLPQSRMRG